MDQVVCFLLYNLGFRFGFGFASLLRPVNFDESMHVAVEDSFLRGGEVPCWPMLGISHQ